MQSIVLGGGCFWCIEAVFQRVTGVSNVISGYSGGNHDTAQYEEVSMGTTGHIEVVQVEFDETIVSLDQILKIFFAAHDPTSMDKQGADQGSQYRSVIFYSSEEQKTAIELVIQSLESTYNQPIVTVVQPLQTFYKAESYHQNFYNSNQSHGYCRMVIEPKLQKLFNH